MTTNNAVIAILEDAQQLQWEAEPKTVLNVEAVNHATELFKHEAMGVIADNGGSIPAALAALKQEVEG